MATKKTTKIEDDEAQRLLILTNQCGIIDALRIIMKQNIGDIERTNKLEKLRDNTLNYLESKEPHI